MSNLTIADFDNAQVAGATNPSAFGHHHGPIPNPNPGWVTPARAAAAATGGRPPAVTVQDNANPPNPASALSAVNSMVCDIAVNGTQMCGRVFTAQPSYRRHVRNEHSGALTNPPTTNTSAAELIAGENALKLFVLSGGWRDARYLHEPGRGPSGSRISEYADACTLIAAQDQGFATRFGRQFHREFDFRPKGTRRPKGSVWEEQARLPLGLLPDSETNTRLYIQETGKVRLYIGPAHASPKPPLGYIASSYAHTLRICKPPMSSTNHRLTRAYAGRMLMREKQRVGPSTPSTGSKRRRGPTPPGDREESPSPSTRRQRATRKTTGRRGGGESSATGGTRQSTRRSRTIRPDSPVL